jgi:hypothetical protein
MASSNLSISFFSPYTYSHLPPPSLGNFNVHNSFNVSTIAFNRCPTRRRPRNRRLWFPWLQYRAQPPQRTNLHFNLSPLPTTNLQKRVSYHACDVSDLSRVQDLFNGLKPATVMHVSSPCLEASNKELYQANIVGTKNLPKCAT